MLLQARSHHHPCTDISCSESVDNFSDHLPLSFTLAILPPFALNSSPSQSSDPVSCSRIAESNGPAVDWQKVSEADSDNYCKYVRDHMPLLATTVVSCCDPYCKEHC